VNFELGEEQVLLRNLVEKFAGDRYDPVRRLAYVRESGGYSPEGWAALAETGLLAFPFAEEFGGFGGGNVELITVMESLGQSVAVEPVLPVILLAGGLIERAGTAEQKAEWLPALSGGTRMAALAHSERDARFNQDHVTTRAIDSAEGVRLCGAKHMVPGGGFADLFVVSAKDAAGAIRFYLVPADASGLQVRSYRMVDGSVASDLVLDNVRAEAMADVEDPLSPVLRVARLAIAAELVGLMQMMFDATLEYVKTRQQFGRPIGAFQAVQFRMADNYTRLELSRSQLYRAAATAEEGAAADAAVTGARAFISANAIALAEDAVQLHGGIGTTEELMTSQAFKRVIFLASLFGDSDWELRRYGALTGSQLAA